MSAQQEAHTLTKRSKDSTKEAGRADRLLADIVESLEDHKATDIVVIDLKGKSDIADYMVIATGQSGRQVSTMADRLTLVLKENGSEALASNMREYVKAACERYTSIPGVKPLKHAQTPFCSDGTLTAADDEV